MGETVKTGSEISGPQRPSGAWSRKRVLVVVFSIISLLLALGSFILTRPFFPAIAWAMALAIVGYPLHRWISRHIRRKDLAAGVSVILIALLVVTPLVLIGISLGNQASSAVQGIRSGNVQKAVDSAVAKSPTFGQIWHWAWPKLSGGAWLEQASGTLASWAKVAISGSVWAGMNLLISFFLLFYFWRDRDLVTGFIRSVLPLSDLETDQVFARVQDTVYASIYGTLAMGAAQGTLGGLMFWILGLPAPLLWGVVMAVLSLVPVLGAFVVWLPAAIFLAAQGNWGKAIILAVWGTVVVSLVDNLLYPILVGNRLRLHTVPVFIAIVGGLIAFGASGLILGPVILSLSDAVLQIWRSRIAQNKTADRPTR